MKHSKGIKKLLRRIEVVELSRNPTTFFRESITETEDKLRGFWAQLDDAGLLNTPNTNHKNGS